MSDYKQMMEMAATFVAETQTKASCPEELADVVRPLLQHEEQEIMLSITLNAKNRVLGIHEVSRGTVDKCHAHPREIFRRAVIDNASRIVVVHNHPSGDSTPSKQDMEVTENLIAAGKILSIEVVDHIIIGKATAEKPLDFCSCRVLGLHKF